MRAFCAIGAAFLMALAMPATGHAEATSGASAVSPPPAADCNNPGVQQCHAWRPRRHTRFHTRHARRGRPAPIAAAPAYYNPPLASSYDSAYDRVMTQHFRPPPLTGEYPVERGRPLIPQVAGTQPYRFAAAGWVFEYDLMADAYVPLAQRDAQRARGVAAPPR